MAKSLSGWQGYPNVCHVCGERIYLSGPKAKGVTFGLETSRCADCAPKVVVQVEHRAAKARMYEAL